MTIQSAQAYRFMHVSRLLLAIERGVLRAERDQCVALRKEHDELFWLLMDFYS